MRALWPTRHDLVRRHKRGPTSLAELRRELVETRRRGWPREDGSVTLGFSSGATAVLDHNGYPQAAMALTFPTDEVDEARHENWPSA